MQNHFTWNTQKIIFKSKTHTDLNILISKNVNNNALKNSGLPFSEGRYGKLSD